MAAAGINDDVDGAAVLDDGRSGTAAADTALRQQEWLAQYGQPVTATVERIVHRSGTSHLVVRCYDPTTGLSHDFEHRLVEARIPVSARQQLEVRVDPDDAAAIACCWIEAPAGDADPQVGQVREGRHRVG